MLLSQIRQIRQRQPQIGGRKLYHILKGFMEEIEFACGRDRFFDLLRDHKLLVERRKKYVYTTNSRHRFRIYSNLVNTLELTMSNQVYVADITYIRTLAGFCYLSLITDACSRKIVGYHLSRSLGIEGSLKALKMALRQNGNIEGLIHHSDRGIQYCSKAYTDLLERHAIKISMTEQNHVYENALAERVNGILKEEFLLGQTLVNFNVAKKMVKQAIEIYNNERPHLSLNYDTPSVRHVA